MGEREVGGMKRELGGDGGEGGGGNEEGGGGRGRWGTNDEEGGKTEELLQSYSLISSMTTTISMATWTASWLHLS